MITLLAVSMVASKAISTPLELVVLSVIKLSILVSVKAVSFVFLTASSNVIVILKSAAIRQRAVVVFVLELIQPDS